ncbi:hypothetical protein ABVT39_012146 [Epinephelus coioides]
MPGCVQVSAQFGELLPVSCMKNVLCVMCITFLSQVSSSSLRAKVAWPDVLWVLSSPTHTKFIFFLIYVQDVKTTGWCPVGIGGKPVMYPISMDIVVTLAFLVSLEQRWYHFLGLDEEGTLIFRTHMVPKVQALKSKVVVDLLP